MGQEAGRGAIAGVVMAMLTAGAFGASISGAEAAQAVAVFKVGLRILPHGPAEPARRGAAPRSGRTIVVRSGDTLSSLALRHYGDASAYGRILKANAGLDPARLRPGMTLLLP